MAENFHTFTINGCLIAVYPMKDVRAAMLQVVVKGGSLYEKGPQWGGFHLLEHLIHDGSQKFVNKEALEIFAEEHGITHNAGTSRVDVSAWYKFPENALSEALTLFEEMFFNSSIPEEKIQREVNVIKQEFIDKWSNPHTRFQRAISQFLFGKDHPLVRDGMGQPEYIANFSRKQLITLKENYFQPQNMFIAIAGKVNPDAAKIQLEKILNQRKNTFLAEPKYKQISSKVKNKSEVMCHQENMDQVILSLNWYLPSKDNISIKERLQIGVASYILGHARGVLYRKLRLELGLVYKCGAGPRYSRPISEYEAWASTNKENVQKVHEVTLETIKKYLTNPIPEDVFRRAVNFRNIQTLLNYDSVGAIAEKMINDLFEEKRVIPAEELIQIANKITEKQAREALYNYVNLKNALKTAILSRENITL